MILSASRRTDIPAFYGEWLLRRLEAGEVLIPDPYRAKHATRLLFSPDTVDHIVFWTKNPVPFLPRLPKLAGLGYPSISFQYTVTAFDKTWEPALPPLAERIEAFRFLSGTLGRERVDWRFDPIVLDNAHTPFWYAEQFARLCHDLAPLTTRCILSFVDHYRHLGKNFAEAAPSEIRRTADLLAPIAAEYGLPLFTCAEEIDLSCCGISRGACIDRARMERLLGCGLAAQKDAGQRPACGCMESMDIGAYNTCGNGCAYCYAVKNRAAVLRNLQAHDPASPLLTGQPSPELILREKAPPSLKNGQQRIF